MVYRGSRADSSKTSVYTSLQDNKPDKVDMQQVNLDAIRPWIFKRTTEILDYEDDIVCEIITSFLEGERYPSSAALSEAISSLMGTKTRTFLRELWTLLKSAQESPAGIPRAFVEAKKRELEQRRLEDNAMHEQFDTAS